jgi:hypothetical protein
VRIVGSLGGLHGRFLDRSDIAFPFGIKRLTLDCRVCRVVFVGESPPWESVRRMQTDEMLEGDPKVNSNG